MFTFSIKREIRHFHVVVQKRQRNVEKSVMHVVVLLIKPFLFLTFSLITVDQSLDLKFPINLHISTSVAAVQNEAECCKTLEAGCITAN